MSATGRTLVAIDSTYGDAGHPSRGVSQETVQQEYDRTKNSEESISRGLINELINEHRATWDKFLENGFCRDMAQNSGALANMKFRSFAKQDYLYLLDYVRFRALRMSKIPQGDMESFTVEGNGIARAVGFATDWFNICVQHLHIPEDELKNAEASTAAMAYAHYLQNETTGLDWFGAHVIIIPCVIGWWFLARRLERDPRTRRDTLFYRYLIEPNLDGRHARYLSSFLRVNLREYQSESSMEKWSTVFKKACQLEVALFMSGQEGHLTG